jgi:hypothetical protein
MSIHVIQANLYHSFQFMSFMSIHVTHVICHWPFPENSVKWEEGGVVKCVFLGLRRQLCCQAKGKNCVFCMYFTQYFQGSSESTSEPSTATEMKLVSSFRVTQQVSSTTAIKSIEFSRRGKCFLVNTADRVIRVYRVSEVLGLKGTWIL